MLKGKHILFLGSSVTYGARANGVSFVEHLAKRNGITYVKEAVSGTTLADNDKTSYVHRLLKNVDISERFDAIVVQLSTNDANKAVPLGEISSFYEKDRLDTGTVIGAMEYIIAYCKEYWDCPIIFYTSPRFDSDAYFDMVQALAKIKEKWGIEVFDMWNELSVDIPEYEDYMADSIHPSHRGYLEWWTPFFEKKLSNILS